METSDLMDSTPTLVVTSDGAKIDHEFEKPAFFYDFFDDRFGKLLTATSISDALMGCDDTQIFF